MEDKLNKNNSKKIIGIILIIVLVLGISYAYFMVQANTNKKQISTGNIDLSFTESDTLVLTNTIPLRDNDVENSASKIDFIIKNTGNIDMYTTINLDSISIDDALKISEFKWALYENDARISIGDFSSGESSYNLANNLLIKTSMFKRYTVRIWLSETSEDQSSLSGLSFSAKVVAKGYSNEMRDGNLYKDLSGANYPKLTDGMIPVLYNDKDDVWEVADVYNDAWYDYDKQMWANAVTVNTNASTCNDNSTCIDNIEKHDRTYYIENPGTPISMDDINSMWVWIPRYKYSIPSNIGSSEAVTEPPPISVKFESDTQTSGENLANCPISATNCYYTHPSFRDGSSIYTTTTFDQGGWDEELTGFWAAKFETSVDGNVTTDNSYKCYTTINKENCDTDNLTPIIKPNTKALTSQTVFYQFLTALKFANGTMDATTGTITFSVNNNNLYGLNTQEVTSDTHMTKNTEWGAVAILSQSQYGKMGNVLYTGINKEVYLNNSYNDTNYGTYTGRSSGLPTTTSYTISGAYSYNNKTCTDDETKCTGAEVENAGVGASTTGTIYGVYDMNGGSQEYIMGIWDNILGASGFSVLPNSQYVDIYTGTNSTNFTDQKSIKGDATYETMKWYSDMSATFIYKSYPYIIRGGRYNASNSSGVFATYISDGSRNAHASFRVTLIP